MLLHHAVRFPSRFTVTGISGLQVLLVVVCVACSGGIKNRDDQQVPAIATAVTDGPVVPTGADPVAAECFQVPPVRLIPPAISPVPTSQPIPPATRGPQPRTEPIPVVCSPTPTPIPTS